MEQVVLEAQRREETGSAMARRMRAEGLVPGVAYGLGQENVVIAIPRNQLEAVLRTEQGLNVLLDLRIKGVKMDKQTAAIVKQIQRHPISREPYSVDFQWISLTETIIVQVRIAAEGEAPGVEQDGGMVDVITHEIEVACLPTNIPDHLVADIAGLQIGDTVRIEQLIVPEGVTILADPADTIVSIAPPIKEEDLEMRPAEELLEGLEEIPLEEELGLEEAEEAAEAQEAEEESD